MPAVRSTILLAGAVERFLTAFYRASLAAPAAGPQAGSPGPAGPADSPRALLARLITAGMLRDDPDAGIALTEEGTRVSLAVLRHHPLLGAYFLALAAEPGGSRGASATRPSFGELTRVLQWLVEAVEQRESVPGPALTWAVPDAEELPYVSLAELPLGSVARLRRIATDDADALRRLESRALRLGTRVTVVARQPGAGPITVRARGRCVVLEHALGAQLLCE